MKKLLLLFTILLSACTAFVSKPEVTLKNVRIAGLDAEGIDLDFYLSVRNPNSFALKLNNYNYDVKIMSLPLARGNSQTPYDFYANSTTDMLIPVKIPYEGLMDILQRRPDPEAIPYQLHADLNIGAALGNMNVPVNKSGTFSIPKEYRPSNALKKLGDFLKGFGNQAAP
jgi:LEA14-like dessication related protein